MAPRERRLTRSRAGALAGVWRALFLLVAIGWSAPAAADELPPPPPPPLEETPPPDERTPPLPPPPAPSPPATVDVDGAGDAAVDDDEAAFGIQPWDAGVPLFSAAGCIAGAALGPILPLGLGVPAAFYVAENPEVVPLPVSDPGCLSAFTVLAFAGVGLAAIAPCSALGATLGAVTAASTNERSVWRPLVGGVPGVLCAVLAPLSCLCFPLPGGSVLTLIGLAVGAFGGPLAVLGATVLDAQLAERTFALVASLGRGDDDDEEDAAAADDVMHY